MEEKHKEAARIVPKGFVRKYTKGNLRIVGQFHHGAVKPCHWQEQRLLTGRDNRNCYKGYFGIESHLCVQNTPTLPFCNLGCVFCWRDIEKGTLDSTFPTMNPEEYDSPAILVEEMIRHSRNIINHHLKLGRSLDNLAKMQTALEDLVQKWEETGENLPRTEREISKTVGISLTSGHRALNLLDDCGVLDSDEENQYWIQPAVLEEIHAKTDVPAIIEKYVTTEREIRQVFKDAQNPKHAAISLAGEPMLYPEIGDLVAEFRHREMTTFIVTNGTQPEKIKQLASKNQLPTQLYVTLAAPSAELYQELCRPGEPGEWEKLQESLRLLKDLPTRTVIRITCVKHANMDLSFVPAYGEIIREAQPDFLDLKGFTIQAHALEMQDRYQGAHDLLEYSPTHEELSAFAHEFEEQFGFEILESIPVSRDLLLRVKWPKGKSILITDP